MELQGLTQEDPSGGEAGEAGIQSRRSRSLTARRVRWACLVRERHVPRVRRSASRYKDHMQVQALLSTSLLFLIRPVVLYFSAADNAAAPVPAAAVHLDLAAPQTDPSMPAACTAQAPAALRDAAATTHVSARTQVGAKAVALCAMQVRSGRRSHVLSNNPSNVLRRHRR